MDLAGLTDGVAGEHRPEPPQLTEARRWSPGRNRLAARDGLCSPALAIGHQQLHAGRRDVPARRREAAEQRFAPLFLVEMKRLRIELACEFLDSVGGEGERADFPPLPDLEFLEEMHQLACPKAGSARRRTMIGVTISHNTAPVALRAAPLRVTMPVPGRLRETLASATSTSSVRSSPGRSGASQRNSLTPGEPSEAVRPIKGPNNIRIMIEQRNQPEPESPCNIDRDAASSSRCIGCGSNSAAKASISSRVTRRGPNVPKWPGGKSSKVSVMTGIGAREARLWPLFAAISTRPLAWLVLYGRAPHLGARHWSCPGQHSELGPVLSAQV